MSDSPPQNSQPSSALRNSRNVVVLNQHGDNRGDEAALSAMLSALEDRLGPGAHFTIVHQFRDPETTVDVAADTTFQSLVIGSIGLVRLALYVLARLVGPSFLWVLDPKGHSIVSAVRAADLVVSAPGGPYIGDIYADHEPVHWLYIWLARAERRPCALYATSAGPFNIRWRNPFRRWTFRCFDLIILREQRSADLVVGLLGTKSSNPEIHTTTDSAFQTVVAPIDRNEILVGAESVNGRSLIAVSALEYNFEGSDPERRQQIYNQEICAAVCRAVERLQEDGGQREAGVAVLLLAQLHSARRDAPYLERLGLAIVEMLDTGGQLDVLVGVGDESLTSIDQRARFASADVVIAGRYHPTVFSISAAVPVVAIPYEHKVTGVMEAAGMGEFLVQIDQVEQGSIVACVDRLFDDMVEVRANLPNAASELHQLSSKTSDLVAGLVR